MIDQFLEWRFRRIIPISHEEFLSEPAQNVHWFHQFEQRYGGEVP